MDPNLNQNGYQSNVPQRPQAQSQPQPVQPQQPSQPSTIQSQDSVIQSISATPPEQPYRSVNKPQFDKKYIVIALVVLVTLLLLGGGYFGYTKFLKKESKSVTNNSSADLNKIVDQLTPALTEVELSNPETGAFKALVLNDTVKNSTGVGHVSYQPDYELQLLNKTRMTYKNTYADMNTHWVEVAEKKYPMREDGETDIESLVELLKISTTAKIETVDENSACYMASTVDFKTKEVDSWQTYCKIYKVVKYDSKNDVLYYIDYDISTIASSGEEDPVITEDQYRSTYHEATKATIKKMSEYLRKNNSF